MLVLVNLAVFLLELRGGERFISSFALTPGNLLRGDLVSVPSVVTHMFLHGGLLHLAGNLWFLLVFGGRVESALGHLGFLRFYFVCGLLAAALHVVSEPQSAVPLIGASGAISGVMGAFLRLAPGERMRVLLVVIPVETPAWLMLIAWAGLQVVHAFSSLQGGAAGVAFWAHVGGFVVGFSWMAARVARRRA